MLVKTKSGVAWTRHDMETFSALLALCAGNSSVTGEFPSQGPVTRSLDIFFDQRLNKRLSKQSWGRCFETPSRSIWRHCNGTVTCVWPMHVLHMYVVHRLLWRLYHINMVIPHGLVLPISVSYCYWWVSASPIIFTVVFVEIWFPLAVLWIYFLACRLSLAVKATQATIFYGKTLAIWQRRKCAWMTTFSPLNTHHQYNHAIEQSQHIFTL